MSFTVADHPEHVYGDGQTQSHPANSENVVGSGLSAVEFKRDQHIILEGTTISSLMADLSRQGRDADYQWRSSNDRP